MENPRAGIDLYLAQHRIDTLSVILQPETVIQRNPLTYTDRTGRLRIGDKPVVVPDQRDPRPVRQRLPTRDRTGRIDFRPLQLRTTRIEQLQHRRSRSLRTIQTNIDFPEIPDILERHMRRLHIQRIAGYDITT